MKVLAFAFPLLMVFCAENPHASTSFTLRHAEEILGEKAELTDSSTEARGGAITTSLTYMATSKDTTSGKTGALYVMFENYNVLKAAKDMYSSIKTANEKNGIETITGLGDEAYYHSDNRNFCFIMLRSGNKILRMKVNKLTSKTSIEAFRKVAAELAADL